jgi:molecular chaperone GrpE
MTKKEKTKIIEIKNEDDLKEQESSEKHHENVEEEKEEKKEIIIESVDIDKLIEKSLKADEYLDHLQRLKAEFENYRKRVSREKSELAAYLKQDLVLELIDVYDNLNRAVTASKNNEENSGLKEGVEIIVNRFWAVLEKNGVSRIECEGQKFDPGIHEAMMVDKNNNFEDGIVTREIQAGYKLADRVIKPGKVSVNRLENNQTE